MGGIRSTTGVFSGIDSASLIQQLLSIEARPKTLAQGRVRQLQAQQAAYLDLNARLVALKTAAGAFRVDNLFNAALATTSDKDIATATASTGAAEGSYTLLVDRLVSTQRQLSRGFADSTTSGLTAGSWTFESAAARLDRDVALSELNGGSGISRGKITIAEAGGGSATIDLSKAVTVSDVLDAINTAQGISVRASVQDGRFVIASTANRNLTVASVGSGTTAASLGIAATGTSTTVTGSSVYSLAASTALKSLNDGNGVFLNSQSGNARFDFTINVDNAGTVTPVKINIGAIYNAQGAVTEAAPTTVGGVLTRINSQLAAALGDSNVTASIAADGVSIRLADSQGRLLTVEENTQAGSNTARDLGILTSTPAATISGRRIFAGLNTTLARGLNGGKGIAGDGSISITDRSGTVRTVNINTGSTVAEIIDAFQSQTGGAIVASLNANGTGISLRDTTNGSSNLIVSGQTATSLGIATDPAGVAASTVGGSNLNRQYITAGTTLASLRSGQGVGSGTMRITDSTGAVREVVVASSATIDDVVRNINSRGFRVQARINDGGDGILLYENDDGAGGAGKIKVEDASGSVALNLNLRGEAAGTGTQNVINGTFEKTVAFAATDSLQQIAQKINNAGVGMIATIVNDGSGSTPFRLSLSARATGTAGRTIVDSGSFDLGLTTIDRGNDARVFFGSTDPAAAVVLTSSRNTLDAVIPNVSIDLKGASSNPVTINVTKDTERVEKAVELFIDAFNKLTDRIEQQTKYNAETKVKAPLLGDSTTLTLRGGVYAAVQGPGINLGTGINALADVGITVTTGGDLKFDRDKFRTALTTDPQAVIDLFSARELIPNTPTTVVPGATSLDPNAPQRFSKLGVMGMIEQFADGYLNTVSGSLTRRNRGVQDQIEAQNQRIAAFDQRLARRQEILERQFRAMEEALGRLQSQQSALGQLAGLAR